MQTTITKGKNWAEIDEEEEILYPHTKETKIVK